jgi:alginate O-acetyltransferase complex protein AlgJ
MVDSIVQLPMPTVRIDFTTGGNFSAFYSEGFSHSEPRGTWSLGAESLITVPLTALLGPAEVTLFVYPSTVAGLKDEQKLCIILNNIEIYNGYISKLTEIRVPVPQNLTKDGKFDLRFIHPTPISPSEGGASIDTRKLAFFFQLLTISAVENLNVGVCEIEPADHVESVKDEAADVHVGINGWLFLTGGTNNVIKYYTDDTYFTISQASQWADLLIARRNRLVTQNITYLHIAAPDKMSVYPEYFQQALPNFDRHPIRLLDQVLQKRGTCDLLINPLGAFAKYPNRDRLYLKTDTHWSYFAAQLLFELVSHRIGEPRTLSILNRNLIRYRRIFDLGSKVVPAVEEDNFSVITASAVARVHENELAKLFVANGKSEQPVAHGGINVVFRNTDPKAIQKTLMIFGDSFMDFQDSNATIIFAENFREVHFTWSNQLDYEYITRVHPEIVVSETAERFMIVVPDEKT